MELSFKSAGEAAVGLAYDVYDCSKEFLRGAVDGGIERPINGIGQVVSLGHLPSLELVDLDEDVSGAKKFAQKAGSTVGAIADYVLLSMAMGKVSTKFLGVPANSVTARFTTSALTGFASGAILEPLRPGESQWNRLSNGATQAASFLTMDALSTGLASKFGTPTLMSSIARGGISGLGAGVVYANMDALTHGRGFASYEQMKAEGLSWATGGAVMGGISYGLNRILTRDTGSTESQTAMTADGERAKIKMTTAADGRTQLDAVELKDGTRLVRKGAAEWMANPGTERAQAWKGDVRLSPDGKLEFVYRYAKAPSTVTVDVKLPDGSRLAVADGASLSLPGGTINATGQTLSDGALASLRKYNIDVPANRLQVDGVSVGNSVNTRFTLELNMAEAEKLRRALPNTGAKIVSAAKVESLLKPQAVQTPVAENVAKEFVYDRPMADHTSTVAYVFRGNDNRLKVLTGTRNIEPFKGHEALPGGFVNLNGQVIEHPAVTASRELVEETGIKMGQPALLRIGDALNRDARNRVIDFQWGVLGNQADMAKLSASDDLGNLAVKDVLTLLKDPKSLAFDHYQLLQNAYSNFSKSLSSTSK